MVDLPIPDNPDVMDQAPQQRVSGNQYAHAGSFLAAGLNHLSEGLEAVATPLAEAQAAHDLQANPVTRDAQGNISVGNKTGLPIFGAAGAAYQQAIKSGTLAGGDNLASQDITQLAAAHPGDPQGLLTAGQAYINNIRAHNPGPIGEAMAQRASDMLTQHYDGAVQTQAAVDVKNSKQAIVDSRNEAFNTLSALAMQGGENTPAYQKALADFNATSNSLTSNPAYQISKDVMAANDKQSLAMLRGYSIAGTVDAAMKTAGGPEKALSDVRDKVNDPSLNLTLAERQQMLSMGEARVHFNLMLSASDRAGLQKDFSAVEQAYARGEITPTPDMIEQMHQKAIALSDTSTTRQIEAFGINLRDDAARRMLLPGQQLNAQGVILSGVNNPGGIIDSPWARAQPGYAGANGRFAKFDTAEHGTAALDANLASYASQGVTTLNQLTAKWAPKGDGANDPVAYAKTLSQATGIDPDAPIDLKDPALRAKLVPAMTRAETGPQTLSSTYDKTFFQTRGPGLNANLEPTFGGGAQAAIQAAEAATGQKAVITSETRSNSEQAALRARFEAGTGGLAARPGQSLHEQGRALDLQAGPILDWLHAHVGEHPEWGVQFLSGHAGQIDPGHLQSSGAPGVPIRSTMPYTPQQIQENPFLLSSWVQAHANDEANRTAYGKKLMAGMEQGFNQGLAPAPDVAATFMQLAQGNPNLQGEAEKFAASMDARGMIDKVMNLPPGNREQFMSAVMAHANGADLYTQQVAEQARKFYEADKKQLEDDPAGYAARRGRTNTLAPVQADNAQGLGVALHQRIDTMDNLGTATSPTRSPLNAGEKEQMNDSIAGGTATQLQNVTSALSTVTGARRAALIADVGPAIMGAANSGDPAKMKVAYSYLDSQFKLNPIEFRKDFGKEGANQLFAYKNAVAFMDPAIAAKRVQGWSDPAQEETRRGVAELAHTELKTTSADSVAKLFGGYSIMNPTTYGQVKAVAPSTDAAASSAQGLLADYRESYIYQRQLGMTAEQAQKNATAMLSTKWGVSGVNGDMVMQYPPEAKYPPIGGSHDWIKDQLDDTIRGSVGGAIDSAIAKKGLTELMTPSERQATALYEADRAIAADRTTEADMAANKPPSYYVVTKDADGLWKPLLTHDPVSGAQTLARFRPDPQAAAEVAATHAPGFTTGSHRINLGAPRPERTPVDLTTVAPGGP